MSAATQIEAEMSYDFKRSFTTTFNNGGMIQFVTTQLRPLHALFGPKIATSGGSARLYGTFKAGFINFSATNRNGLSGLQRSASDITSGNTFSSDLSRSRSGGFLWATRIAGQVTRSTSTTEVTTI
jgi:hypothetical protein